MYFIVRLLSDVQNMAPGKRQRTEIPLYTKYIIKDLDSGSKQTDVAKKYGINESTVSGIEKYRQAICQEFEMGERI